MKLASKLLFSLFAVSVLFTASCTNDNSDGLYDSINRDKININRPSGIDRDKIIIKKPEAESVERGKIIIRKKS